MAAAGIHSTPRPDPPMTWGMDPKGDITDTFDDDSLRESIEKADQAGQWRENAAGFLDPKLEQIRKQLAEPERVDYAERRRRDLQRRAAAAAAAELAAQPVVAPPKLAPPPVDWRETVVTPSTVIDEPDDDMLARLDDRADKQPSSLPAEIQHPLLGYVRPVLHGLSVFLPITVVQMVVAGAHFDLLLRGLVASIAAGVAWSQFHAGRFRTPMIGIGIYALAFLTTPGALGNRSMVANMVGFLMTLLGSGVVGFLREQNDGQGSARL